jgi:hypothetical protein
MRLAQGAADFQLPFSEFVKCLRLITVMGRLVHAGLYMLSALTDVAAQRYEVNRRYVCCFLFTT